MIQASVKVQFRIHCVRRSCILIQLVGGGGAMVRGQESSPPVLSMPYTQNCRETWLMWCVLRVDETSSNRSGVNSLHSLVQWAQKNPRGTWCSSFQQRTILNIWAGIIDNYVIGPYVIANYLHEIQYVDFHAWMLPFLLKDVPFNVCEGMFFQWIGTPSHI
jgi:hypothetical protein